MAYALSNPLRRIGPQGSGNALFMYVDGDTLATIDAADYFLLDVAKLKVGDVILAVGNDVAGVASVLSRTDAAVDTSNFGGALEAAIDSD